MMKRIATLLLAIALILSFVGCSFFSPDKDKETEEIEKLPEQVEEDENFPVDINGVTIAKKPEKIVVLSAAIVEKMKDMKVTDGLVGVALYTKEADEYKAVGTPSSPDIKAIVELETDLIITEVGISSEDRTVLLGEGISILELGVPSTVDELWQNYKDIAIAIEGKTDGEETASTLVGKADYMLNSLKAAVAEGKGKSALYVRSLDFTLATGDTLISDVLGYIGFENIAEKHSDWNYPKKDAEESIEDFKAVDFYIIDESEITIKDFEKSAFYKGLPATLQDRYVSIDYLAVERSGIDMLTQVKVIVEYAYPDAEIEEWDAEIAAGDGDDKQGTDPENPADEGEITDPE